RSQLLAYNIMFGPDYTLGACPGCTSLGDELDGTLVHLNHRDVTLIGSSRAPIERLTAYKERMGWQFPYVSTYGTDFPFDFGLAMTEEQTQQVPEVKAMIDDPVPLEYSIGCVTCTVAGVMGAMVVGLPGAAQDRLPADVPGARPGRPGVPRRPGERCRAARAPAPERGAAPARRPGTV